METPRAREARYRTHGGPEMFSLKAWPLSDNGPKAKGERVETSARLLWKSTRQLAYPKGSMVPVEDLPFLVEQEAT